MFVKLIIDNLSKSFNTMKIVNNFSYTFETGCYCVTGPNGVGKTTLLEMIAGIDLNHHGKISLIKDEKIANDKYGYKKELCFIPSKPSFFPSSTGQDFLNFIFTIKDKNNQTRSEVLEYIDKFKIGQYLNTKFNEMSLGTQKKFFLCTLLMGVNSLIVLDEPTNALDADSFSVLSQLLVKLSASAIVILSTHDQKLVQLLMPTVLDLEHLP